MPRAAGSKSNRSTSLFSDVGRTTSSSSLRRSRSLSRRYDDIMADLDGIVPDQRDENDFLGDPFESPKRIDVSRWYSRSQSVETVESDSESVCPKRRKLSKDELGAWRAEKAGKPRMSVALPLHSQFASQPSPSAKLSGSSSSQFISQPSSGSEGQQSASVQGEGKGLSNVRRELSRPLTWGYRAAFAAFGCVVGMRFEVEDGCEGYFWGPSDGYLGWGASLPNELVKLVFVYAAPFMLPENAKTPLGLWCNQFIKGTRETMAGAHIGDWEAALSKIEDLLRKGANPNAPCVETYAPKCIWAHAPSFMSITPVTVLEQACLEGCAPLIELLLKWHADPKAAKVSNVGEDGQEVESTASLSDTSALIAWCHLAGIPMENFTTPTMPAPITHSTLARLIAAGARLHDSIVEDAISKGNVEQLCLLLDLGVPLPKSAWGKVWAHTGNPDERFHVTNVLLAAGLDPDAVFMA